MPYLRIRPPLLCLISIVLFVACRQAGAEEEVSPPPPAFAFADVQTLAANLAAAPYAHAPGQAPEFLRALGYEEWRQLRYRHEKDALWNGNGGARLQPRFLLPGFLFNQFAAVNVVDENGVRRLPFSPELIEAADKNLVARMREEQLGFAGFRLDAGDGKGEIEAPGLVGTSHFQFTGRNARFGPFARPLALDTALPSGEQFSFFREFWLQTPQSEDAGLTVFALMDSPGITGAFEFVITPGSSTVLDVRATFHARKGAAKPAKIGLAPMTGMFLFSETDGGRANDYRPEVHNTDGLLVADDAGWHWTPLKNPQRLAVNSFPLDNPRGFGLLQRDGNFDHYQDLANRYDLSSSLWVEPKGDWGAGAIELVEIPGTRDFHPNIIAYWIPAPDATRQNGDAPAFSVEYRLYWMPPASRLHELGLARDTRMQRGPDDNTVTLIIDFEGEALAALPADTGLTSVVDLPKEVSLVDKQLEKNTVTGGWRLTLTLTPPQGGVLDSLLAARDGPPLLPVSAHLKKGENLAEVLTETWRYNLIP